MTTGLVINPNRLRRKVLSAAPVEYVTPAYIDLRAQLLESNDQGVLVECAAYAMAGCLEYYNWRQYGIAQQIDPHPIYARAKQLDGLEGIEGTTLEAVTQAAQDLGLVSWADNAAIREVSTPDQVKQALHRNGVLLAAFQITKQWEFADAEGWIPEGDDWIGGHGVVLCAYDQVSAKPFYGVQGSWGPRQGWRGFNRLTPAQFSRQFSYALAFNFGK